MKDRPAAGSGTESRNWPLLVLAHGVSWACVWAVTATVLWVVDREGGWWDAAALAVGPAVGILLGTVLTEVWQGRRRAEARTSEDVSSPPQASRPPQRP